MSVDTRLADLLEHAALELEWHNAEPKHTSPRELIATLVTAAGREQRIVGDCPNTWRARLRAGLSVDSASTGDIGQTLRDAAAMLTRLRGLALSPTTASEVEQIIARCNAASSSGPSLSRYPLLIQPDQIGKSAPVEPHEARACRQIAGSEVAALVPWADVKWIVRQAPIRAVGALYQTATVLATHARRMPGVFFSKEGIIDDDAAHMSERESAAALAAVTTPAEFAEWCDAWFRVRAWVCEGDEPGPSAPEVEEKVSAAPSRESAWVCREVVQRDRTVALLREAGLPETDASNKSVHHLVDEVLRLRAILIARQDAELAAGPPSEAQLRLLHTNHELAALRAEVEAYRKFARDSPASRPEPPPSASTGPAIWPLVCDDLRADFSDIEAMCAEAMGRDAFGQSKYGQPVRPFNGRDALTDAYQEALDLSVYLRQVIAEGHEDRNDYNLALRLAVNLHRRLRERTGGEP